MRRMAAASSMVSTSLEVSVSMVDIGSPSMVGDLPT